MITTSRRVMGIVSLLGRSKDFQTTLEQARSKLYRMAYAWCRSPAVADDLVQETLVRALRHADQLRDLATVQSWLFSILANCTRDYFRSHRTMEDIEDVSETDLVSNDNPLEHCSQDQVVLRVRAAVAELPMTQRQVLVLVDLEEFSYAEVAAILDIPIGTVMSRLSRGRQALKAKLIDAR